VVIGSMAWLQVNEEIEAALAAARATAAKKGRETSENFPGIMWKRAERYEGAWNVLPK
jgi:hypothetical protein